MGGGKRKDGTMGKRDRAKDEGRSRQKGRRGGRGDSLADEACEKTGNRLFPIALSHGD